MKKPEHKKPTVQERFKFFLSVPDAVLLLAVHLYNLGLLEPEDRLALEAIEALE